MTTHSIAEARDNLSRLVARARSGETVVLTSHGRPVAKITGLEPAPKRRMTEADIDDLRRFTDSLGEPGPVDAGTFVSRMRDEYQG